MNKWDKIENILTVIFVVGAITLLALMIYVTGDSEVEHAKRIEQQIREEKLWQGGWDNYEYEDK